MLEAWITFIESPTSELIDKLEMSSDEIKEAKDLKKVKKKEKIGKQLK